MAKFIISKPTVKVNNEAQGIVPNSCVYTEGEGETNVLSSSTGGGSVEVVISDSAEDKLSSVKFDLFATPQDLKNARGWKKLPGQNVVTVDGEVGGKSFSRVFEAASISNDYEAGLQSEGKIPLEWKSAPAI